MDGKPIKDDNGNAMPPHKEDAKVGSTFSLSRDPITGWELNKAVKGTAFDDPAAENTYKITAETPNELEFTLFYQKRATITANSFSKQYDGDALRMPTDLVDQVRIEGLLDGDEIASVSLSYANTDVTNGRLNAGVATVTPGAATVNGRSGNYYKFRYISGTLEVTKINVTVRVEPDRWTGNVYSGTEYKAGFTNAGKQVADYIMISHAGYKADYEETIKRSGFHLC